MNRDDDKESINGKNDKETKEDGKIYFYVMSNEFVYNFILKLFLIFEKPY